MSVAVDGNHRQGTRASSAAAVDPLRLYGLAAHRKRLGLPAKEYGALVGSCRADHLPPGRAVRSARGSRSSRQPSRCELLGKRPALAIRVSERALRRPQLLCNDGQEGFWVRDDLPPCHLAAIETPETHRRCRLHVVDRAHDLKVHNGIKSILTLAENVESR